MAWQWLGVIAPGHCPLQHPSPSDAIWWSYVIITTVGYGDRFPTMTTGRIVGVLL